MEEAKFAVAAQSVGRIDGIAKVTGSMQYGDDINRFGQLYMATLYAEYPSAEILSVDPSGARKLEGVVDIITARDIPGNPVLFGRFPVLVGDEVRFIGDGIVSVAAETKEIARHALTRITVRYGKVYRPITTVREALEPGARIIHADKQDNYVDFAGYKLINNDVEQGFAESDLILERFYATGFVDQGYIEPEALVAEYDPNTATLLIQGSIQNPYSVRQAVAGALGLKFNQVRVLQSAIGGSFGGKDEGVIVNSARAALLALRTRRPVKVCLTREESFLTTSKRHPFDMEYRIGLKRDGTIRAVETRLTALAGPYNKQAMFANWRASIHAAGPYAVPHIRTRVDGVYSNTVYGGAYRGFSAPQVLFGTESLIDECADALGIDPAEFRLRNCLGPYSTLSSGQIMDPALMPSNLARLITVVNEKTGFSQKWREYREPRKDWSGGLCRGIGMAITFRGAGLGGEGIDSGSAQVTIDADGCVMVQTGFTEMGQGLSTTLCQVAAELLGLPLADISWLQNDTAANMDPGPSVASRGIMIGGMAVKNAVDILKARMGAVLGPLLECGGDEPEFRDGEIRNRGKPGKKFSFREGVSICLQKAGISLSTQGWYSPGPPAVFDHATGQGPAYASYLLGATVAELTVDCPLGKIRVERMVSAVELGRAINPGIVRGQLTGGLVQGLGFALMEDMDVSGGYLKTLNFDDFLIPTAMDVPPIDILLFEGGAPGGPFGAKGIGELGVEMAAPAIANAHANATGRRVRRLPLNPERVRQAGHR
ncbi:MAG: xanthine dehydrogenase family protein molybdopterin-binding subunit [Treponema sp.]|jgi:CO/xanthine dehydrogenase Mo-binding subunit|nr:xanthine dehydrogenase family protein molybdopterin-binding subunit [Treponema sp.]